MNQELHAKISAILASATPKISEVRHPQTVIKIQGNGNVVVGGNFTPCEKPANPKKKVMKK